MFTTKERMIWLSFSASLWDIKILKKHCISTVQIQEEVVMII